MAYATLTGMVDRYSRTEMIRLSAISDELPDEPVESRVMVALDDATGLIDSYLRRRYLVPLSPVPREIVRACCVLARYDLQLGDGKTPTEEALTERRQIERWLESLRDGEARLDAPTIGTTTGARMRDRPRVFTGQGLP